MRDNRFSMTRFRCAFGRLGSVIVAFATSALLLTPVLGQAPAQSEHPPRPPMPTRDPHSPGYAKATVLPDGSVPAANADGNFIIGPTHNPAPEIAAALQASSDTPANGAVIEFTMNSSESKVYPGIARDS